MWACAVRSKIAAGALCLAFGGAGAPALADTPAPQRVVSLNLCTDQLAMLLAAPGQLRSVSHLAADPRSSAMADAARAYPANHGRAEEIYLMRPDLVLAGTYTARATVAMLERLGLRVETFEPVTSLDEVPAQIRRIGALLGRKAEAEAMVATFHDDLAALRPEGPTRPRVALYDASGYTTGDRGLAGQILNAAGLANIAVEAGLSGGGYLPLELLVMLNPEAVITSHPYPGASRAEEVMRHPAVAAVGTDAARGTFSDRHWVCGTPHVLQAVAEMVALRRGLTGAEGG
ncbi:ABC transporter substrate-binding protein [Szabonella alba]|uniref:ABC transporter substrate-binding protein n=1 Tax=Szabonella alba TaxID=2804194 RepID=A0A8K0VF27_9RHOB|nr:ABC transporter substrate-binding protein [Szabonella alba]MBL4918494.1 ABC transporter substrate-binding protein [Szabonella alba]